MAQSQQQQGMADVSAYAHGMSQEVSTLISSSDAQPLIRVQFLDMLEPSFALVTRYERDQHRVEAENELKLQNQLNQFWRKINRLEQHVQKSEADRLALNQSLQQVEQDKAILGSRVLKLEANKALTDRFLQELEADRLMLQDRVEALEKDGSATEQSRTSLETATPSVRSTPNIVTRDQETECEYALAVTGLDPIKLHSKLPGVLFIVDPQRKKISDGSEFPLLLIKEFREYLAEMMSDGSIDAERLAQLQDMSDTAFTVKDRCLYRHLQQSGFSRKKTVWTKHHKHSYACRTCVNKQRLCISLAQGQMLVLPLHPLLRTFGRSHENLNREVSAVNKPSTEPHPNELQYWVAPNGSLTQRTPYDVDIWSVPSGQH